MKNSVKEQAIAAKLVFDAEELLKKASDLCKALNWDGMSKPDPSPRWRAARLLQQAIWALEDVRDEKSK